MAPPGEEQNPEQDKEVPLSSCISSLSQSFTQVKDIVEGLQMKGDEKEAKLAAATNPTDEEIPSAPAAVSNPPDCPAPTASVPAAPTEAPPAAASLPDNAAAVAAPAPPAAALSAG